MRARASILAAIIVTGMIRPLAPAAAQTAVVAPSPPEERTKEALLRTVVAAHRRTLAPGDSIHWAESRDSVIARFATCRPYKDTTACILNDTVPTFSFEIEMHPSGAATVATKRYAMVPKTCPMRTPLDPPIIGWDVNWVVWHHRDGRWVRDAVARSVVC